MSSPREFPYDVHFLVCTGSKCNAPERGENRGEEIRAMLKQHNREMGRKESVRVCGVTCLDLCEDAPNMLIWPDGVVYSRIDREEAMRIYRETMGDQ